MFKPSPPQEPWSHDFRHVLSEELDQIEGKEVSAEDPIARAHKQQLVGLAFSGGGIRSATFNLGVLQSLARLRLLSKFDYLSTVSGGGYIGSWLMAWIHRRGVKDVWEGLRPQWKWQPGQIEAQEIRFLRRFSNYLTPKLGWLGADMWTVIAIYLRNLILNLTIVGAAFALVLLLPRWVAIGSVWFWTHLPWWLLATIALGALFGTTVAILRSMRYFSAAHPVDKDDSQIISELERRLGWRDANGDPVEIPLPNAPAAWYGAEFFEDFILSLSFKITQPAEASIYVWTPWIEEGGSGKPDVAKAVRILVACADKSCQRTGSINEQTPVRPPAIHSDWNRLEIICADDRCTVRVNNETINTLRVVRLTRPRRWMGGSPRAVHGAIGIEKGKVHFKDLEVRKVPTASSTGATQGQVQRWIITPLFLAAFLGTFLFGFGDYFAGGTFGPFSSAFSMRQSMGLLPLQETWGSLKCALLAGTVAAAFVFAARLLWAGLRKQGLPKGATQILPATVAIFVAAGVGGLLIRALYAAFFGRTLWEVMVWGTPAVLMAFLCVTVLLIGLLGRSLPDERREWWSRLAAWVLIYSLAWIAICGLAFYAPALIRYLIGKNDVFFNLITASWVVSTVTGLIAARSAATGNQKSSKLVEILATVAPYVFVAGFLCFLSWAVDALIVARSNAPFGVEKPGFSALLQYQWALLYHSSNAWLLWVTVGAFIIALVLSLRLDINQFSMHLLYRNRLGRCYLGASNALRRAQAFTGFSATDDLWLSELSKIPFHGPDAAPYPIINTALNLVGGKELAWQQRKGASFVFTPLYCGYEFPELPPGYCKTQEFAAVPSQVSLATAMAISGAAASPNMGYHTSPAPAFLMTVFNVRLGWWVGNPRQYYGYRRSGPLNVLGSLVSELFGLTSDEGKYIYLSDGGHFENLGIYELVRRRCRFIVACDAEEDHTFGFGGLGNAIEKCRSDFGIDIDIDVEPIRRQAEAGHSDWHCAIGKVHYSRVDSSENARDGILIYLKSSLTGDEPTDVLRYAAANAGFPHQSTGDQWFDESQFESYRVLGYHVAENVFGVVGSADTISKLTNEELFVELSQKWYPPSAPTAEAFTKHTHALATIYEELRANKDLEFLNRDIYPEWRVLFQEGRSVSPGLAIERPELSRDQLPDSPAEKRAGFYICTAICDLFEAVYVDLQLEHEFDHPDNRGWMNFFRHWSAAPMFRVTWAIGASNYGARFQSFCSQHLNLKIGRCLLTPIDPKSLADVFDSKDGPPAIATISEKIVEAIWTWLDGLPVGSEVSASAGLTVTKRVPDSNPLSGPLSKAEEDRVKERARELIQTELDRLKDDVVLPKKEPEQKDEEWYAAATLLEFLRRQIPENQFSPEWPTKVAELAHVHAAAVASHALANEFHQLNPTERELIELFFIFHPSLAASAEIRCLKITPDPRERVSPPSEKSLCFSFGFAILAKTQWPQSADDRPKLVYLRVQDHLRRMGLARSALEKLLGDLPELEIDLQKMHPDAHEVPTDKDRNRLFRLFHSVKAEICQKKNA
jgi:hypothetical protein